MPGTDIAEKAKTPTLQEMVAGVSVPKRLVLMLVAERVMPTPIITALTEMFGPDHGIADSWVYSVSSWLDRPEKYKPIIDAIRERLGDPDVTALLDPTWRMQQREKIIKGAIADGQFTEARHGLSDVDRMQGVDPGPRQASGPTGGNVNLQVNNFASGDMNRPPANDAEYAEWHRQVEFEFGLPPRLPVDQETAKCDGSTDEREQSDPGGNGDGT